MGDVHLEPGERSPILGTRECIKDVLERGSLSAGVLLGNWAVHGLSGFLRHGRVIWTRNFL